VKDPLIRFERWMRTTGRWDDAADTAATESIDAMIERGVDGVNAAGPADPHDLFRHLYEDEPVTLQRQRAEFERHLAGSQM